MRPTSAGSGQRSSRLLDAQSAYQDAMRSLDAHWSAMAGFRVGQLYHQLPKDGMEIPLPSNAKTLREKQLWEGSMRVRYRILLEKGLKGMKATVELGERARVRLRPRGHGRQPPRRDRERRQRHHVRSPTASSARPGAPRGGRPP